MKINKNNNIDIGSEMLSRYMDRTASNLEKVINKYITIKLVNGKTYIYVNGRRFIQCIRLILNIPKKEVHLYDDVDSIDEAAKLYSKHVYQNRIVTGPMAAPVSGFSHNITPDQEFWGHCSNIEAWIEHGYDTRILMSNISFPLLRELARAGDPVATKVFKEEIALRLESGYPSVVQYLLNQGYISNFTPTEFKTILESTELIKNLSSNSKMLAQFLISCSSKFSSLLGDILLQILELPEGKTIVISSINAPVISRTLLFSRNLRQRPQYLFNIKTALEQLFKDADEKTGEEIIDIISVVEKNIKQLKESIPDSFRESRYAALPQKQLDVMLLQKNLEVDDLFAEKFIEQFNKFESKCSYCGKKIPKGNDICYWCGHKKDDDEGGFFPFPYLFKPPGGGGSMKEAVAVSVKTEAQI